MVESIIKVELKELPGTRNELGQYQSAQTEQLNRNRLFSEYLREQLGRRIENHIASGKRAGASTGRLVRASADSRNTIVTKEFVGIGRPDWLDHSQARYWRTFEEGSAALWKHPFVGTQLFPVGGKSGYVPHGAMPGIRTGGEARADGRFVVKHEIAPANIYRTLAAAELHKIESFSVQSARKFLVRVFGEENLLVRGKG